jgi:DNA repair exonuclease SbcCD ATPase subunit
MTNTVEERVELLESHARFNAAISEKVDRVLSEFHSRLRQIHVFSSATNAGQLEYWSKASREFSELESKVVGLRRQNEQMDERLAEVEVKLDQVIRLLTPEPLGQ